MSISLAKLIGEETDETIGKIYQMKTGFEAKEEEPDDPKMKKRTKAAPKTIWGKFSVQIQDLMFELAEPLTQELDDPSIGHKPDPKILAQ